MKTDIVNGHFTVVYADIHEKAIVTIHIAKGYISDNNKLVITIYKFTKTLSTPMGSQVVCTGPHNRRDLPSIYMERNAPLVIAMIFANDEFIAGKHSWHHHEKNILESNRWNVNLLLDLI